MQPFASRWGIREIEPFAPMSLRLTLALLACLSLAPLRAQAPPAGTLSPPTVQVRATITKLNADGKSEVFSVPTIIAPSGAEARVQVAGKIDPKTNKPEGGLECVMTPTVLPTGEISLAFRVVITEPKIDNKDSKADKRERKREAKLQEGSLIFYSALPSEGIFSIQDGKGNRRWYKLNASIDGWKLESYDDDKQQLIVSQGTTHQELRLYKSNIDASASELSSVVTLHPGETVKVPGVGGLEVSVSATVVAGR